MRGKNVQINTETSTVRQQVKSLDKWRYSGDDIDDGYRCRGPDPGREMVTNREREAVFRVA